MAEGFVDTNGVRLWYEELGEPDGAAVVLVMGVDASAVWWPPDLVDGLVAAGHRVVRFDNRDIGLSSHIDYERAPYGLNDLVADTVGLIDALGIDSAHFVGMSMGGMIGQVVALRHPDRVRTLALISTTPGPDDRLAPSDDTVFAGLDRPAETDDELAELTIDFCRALTGSRFPFDESYYRSLVSLDSVRGTNMASSHQLVVPASPSRIDRLATVRVPTLVVHGTEDPIFPVDHAEALAKAISGAKLVRWEGVGHELPPQLVPELTQLLIDHARPRSRGGDHRER